MPYELILLKSFTESLQSYTEKDRKKILEKAEYMLSEYPYRYEMLKGPFKINGVDFVGLRKFKSGLSGRHGGAYVLYRICEECKKNKHNQKSDLSCSFCDDSKGKHVVLFISRPRGLGY